MKKFIEIIVIILIGFISQIFLPVMQPPSIIDEEIVEQPVLIDDTEIYLEENQTQLDLYWNDSRCYEKVQRLQVINDSLSESNLSDQLHHMSYIGNVYVRLETTTSGAKIYSSADNGSTWTERTSFSYDYTGVARAGVIKKLDIGGTDYLICLTMKPIFSTSYINVYSKSTDGITWSSWLALTGLQTTESSTTSDKHETIDICKIPNVNYYWCVIGDMTAPIGISMINYDFVTDTIYSTYNDVSLSYYSAGSGYVDDVDDVYTFIIFDNSDTYIREFNGTTFSTKERVTGGSVSADRPRRSGIKRANNAFIITGKINAYPGFIYKRFESDPWSEYSASIAGVSSPRMSFHNPDSSTGNVDVKYVFTEDTEDSSYFLNDGGYLIKFDNKYAQCGYNDLVPPYLVQKEDFDIWDVSIFKAYLKPTTCEFEYGDTDLSQGDGLILYNDDDELLGIFEIDEIPATIDTQIITGTSPEQYDLSRPITYTFTAQTAHDILDYLLNNYCGFLYVGTTNSPGATTYTKELKKDSLKSVFEWLAEVEGWGIRWDEDGSTDYTAVSGESAQFTVDDTGNKSELKVRGAGRIYNGVLLLGGIKSDGSIAELLVVDPKGNAQQVNYVTKHVPHMIDDTDAAGNEMYDFGVQFLSTLDQEFRNIRFEAYDTGRPYILKPITVTDAEWSISAVEYIVYGITYYPESDADYCKIDAYNYLFFVGVDLEDADNLPNANKVRIDQLGELVDGKIPSSDLLDEDDMASDSDTKPATQQSIKVFVENIVNHIPPSVMYGYNGFALNANYGGNWTAAINDTNAAISASFHVKKGGSFKFRFIWESTAAHNMNGTFYATAKGHGESTGWNLASAVALNMGSGSANTVYIVDSTAYTIDDDEYVGLLWVKNDAGGGSASNVFLHGIYLIRQ